MPALLTKNFKILLAKQVYNMLDLSSNSYLPTARRNYVYAFIGKALEWPNGVPTPTEDVPTINEAHRKAIYAKQISLENASLVVERNDWVANTVYNTYDSDTNFYVRNSKDQVFKCLSNVAVGTASTDQPELTLSSTSLEEPYLKTSDGYKWKYMYTMTSLQKQRFLSDDWMPVAVNKFVKNAAQSGSIDIVTITNSGNNYTAGSVQPIITIDGDGTGAILKANVSSPQTLTGKANVLSTSVVVTGNGTSFLTEISIGDTVNFGGVGKTIISLASDTSLNVNSAFATSNTDLSITTLGGKVQDIVIQNRGNDYTYADLIFEDVAGGVGAGASATVSFAPFDGHGYDPIYELNATTIMFNVEFADDESGVLPVDNDFRQVSILYNPYTYGTTKNATAQAYTMYTRITTSPGIGNFNNDETVYQGTNLSNSTFRGDVISFDEVRNLLYLNNVRGTIQNNKSISGANTGAVRIINAYDNPTLDLYSGKVLYISNKTAIMRDPAQTERIRFIMSF